MRRFTLVAASFVLAVALPSLLTACSSSHGRGGDGGVLDGGECGPIPGLFCVAACGSDAGRPPVCTDGAWACPPGTRDISTCPPTCVGPPPFGCVCDGGAWLCEGGTCPPGLDPWNPDDPVNRCSVEGAECSNGGGACGAAMFCTCRAGSWQCAVAEPDPVCTCGRQPSEGDPCVEEGASCGACCPEPGGWPAMICEGGRWTSAACPDIDCPPVLDLLCPARTETLIGRGCSVDGASCGDACCGDHVMCEDGRWVAQDGIPCVWCEAWPCGDGSCHGGEYCHHTCGPDDGAEYFCEPMTAGCTSCECIPLWGTQGCEMIDGRPHVFDLGFCG